MKKAGLMNITLLCAMLGLPAAALAQNQTSLQDLDVGAFTQQDFQVATATDKKTRLRFMIVKMKDGHMMVLTPAEAYMMLLGMSGSPNISQ